MGARRFLGEILQEMGLLDQEKIKQILAEQQQTGEKFGEILLKKQYVTEEQLTKALAKQFDLPYIELKPEDIDPEAVKYIPQDVARQHKIVPYKLRDGVLIIAMSDPLDLFTLDNIRFMVNAPVECVLATPTAIKNAQIEIYGVHEEHIDQMLESLTESDVQLARDTTEEEEEELQDDAPVIKLVTLIITEAVKMRASDIHIEPMENRLRIRYRIDGVCREVDSPPKRLQKSIISRIKLMAKMDIAEKRLPQDGRIKINLLGRQLDLRVSTLPSTYGESVVLRILDKASVKQGLHELGFDEEDYKIFRSLIRKPNGIILVTGPTGSGKTTTLYAALNELNTPDRKIITAEDPVEYYFSGINQAQVNVKTGMTFQRIIRAMLRQAPNVILVGEIRDRETAEIAIQAALTGHLVFSTLHTNDAPSAITRLIDIGIKPFLVASSIQAVMAQRLVRVLCPECKEPYTPGEAVLKSVGLTKEQLKGRSFYRAKGCKACDNVGYKGRIGIFEIMVMNSRLRELTFKKASTNELRKEAIFSGMHTLFQDGIRKVLAGITSLEEIYKVAKVTVE